MGDTRIQRFTILSAVFCATLICSEGRSMDVQIGEAPSDDLALTLSAIQSAKRSLKINIYELSSAQITDALSAKIGEGVEVTILEEGQPAGGMSAAGKGIQSQLIDAMQSSRAAQHFYEMTSKAGGKRRFRFDHAKYAIIDDESLLIGSENYSPTGNPVPGTVGNRGWEVFVHDSGLAQQFNSILAVDANTSHGDVLDLSGPSKASFALNEFWNLKRPPKQQTPPKENLPLQEGPVMQASSIDYITAPDTSLSGLEKAIANAQSNIEIEQMTFDPNWKPSGQDPLLADLINAAQRGVHIRILLNDETVFDHPGHPSKPKNRTTLDLLSGIAAKEGLPLEVRIANLKGMGVDYIHNKGMLVDGNITLISSINWDENAIEHNREAAVLIDSPEINAHYEELFSSDWNVSQ